ncbi:MAG: magnesium and cobalt transport protein CorA [Calditrichaeota bacterium]|nr:MAG: magnesium and cobalt transport protein CorA [Calditrichota bacterium]
MKIIRQYSEKAGLPPGKVVFVGEQKLRESKIHIIQYNKTHVTESDVQTIDEAQSLVNKSSVTWIDIAGLHQVRLIEDIGKAFQIHPLVLEDIVHTSQRPKLEEFDDYIFFVLRMFYFHDKKIVDEQISIILGENHVFTFQERSGDIFDPMRERIRSKKFRITKQNSDYLAYSLIDAIVDNYFVILETLGERVESVENDLLLNPSTNILQEIHTLKREMISLRRSVWPLREVINKLDRTESALIKKPTRIYVRDVYDHTIQVIDAIENYRDIVSGMLDTYLSSLSNHMNEVMKTLTIIATIFIPLTFIVGVYGMNFEYMPELKWHWGYWGIWLIMVIIAIVMVFYFRKKKWL